MTKVETFLSKVSFLLLKVVLFHLEVARNDCILTLVMDGKILMATFGFHVLTDMLAIIGMSIEGMGRVI